MKKRLLFILLSVVFFSGVSWAQTTIISENIGSPSTTTLITSYTGWQNNGSYTFDGSGDVRNSTVSSGYTGASGNGNVFLTNTVGKYFQISGINTSAYTSLALSVGVYKSTTASTGSELLIQVSSDGTNYTNLSFSIASGTGTAKWYLVAPTGTIPSTANLRIRFYQNGSTPQFRIDDVKLTGTLSLASPPALTSASGATVDNAFNVTFLTDDATWRGAISSITVNGTTLTAGYDKTQSSKIVFTPSASTPASLLQQSSITAKTIVIKATGYSDATVSQTISSGAVSASTSTATIGAALTLNGTSTVTATAKDQYSNAVSGYYFKVLPTITNTTATTGESYTVNGTSYTSTPASAATLASATNSSGVATFTAVVPSFVDGGDGISVQVKLNDGTTNIGSAFAYTAPTTPALTIASSALSELTLNGAQVSVTLSNTAFIDGTLSGANFTLNNAPSGTSVNSVTYNSATNATVTLTFNGTDFDANVSNFSITVAGSELTTGSPVTSNTLTITAITEVVPTLTTTAISGTTSIAASSGGNISSDGGGTASAAVTARGVCWSTTQGAETASGNFTSDGTGTGSFTSTLSGLLPNTLYYVKAYATNSVGTAYGSEVSFTTNALSAPTADYATNFSTTGFTANWEAVTGATSYRLDVYSMTAGTNATDLFISEYIEGSSNNKYIEIFNGTGADVNLSDYQLILYPNGGTSANPSTTLSGTLANNSVIVYKNSGAALTLPAGVTATTNASVNYNGDDAIALLKISTGKYVDIFGRIGEDPGANWASATNSTVDKTLVRKSTVTGGVTENPASGFPTLETEWTQYDMNTVSYLGAHTFAGGSTQNYVVQDLTVNGTSYTVSSLSPNTKYYYRVRAYSTSNTSANSSTIALTTPNLVTAPTVPTGTDVPVTVTGSTGISTINFGSVTTGGNLAVSRFSDAPANPTGITNTNTSWYRWIIEPPVGFGFTNYTLTFKRTDINGISIAGAQQIPAEGENTAVILYKRSTPGSGAFTNVGALTYHQNGTPEDISDDYLVSQPLTSFSEFVLGSDQYELPVELSTLSAKVDKRNVHLDWTTATEVNSYKFVVERSLSGANSWNALGEVRASNYSNSPKSYGFDDKNLNSGKYSYRLKMVDNDGSSEYSAITTEAYIGTPAEFSLAQNYPNPFNPTTKITYALPSNSHVTIELYAITGQKIATLLNGNVEAGYYDLPVNMSGYNLSSGMYIYRFSGKELSSGKQFTSVKKMMFLK